MGNFCLIILIERFVSCNVHRGGGENKKGKILDRINRGISDLRADCADFLANFPPLVVRQYFRRYYQTLDDILFQRLSNIVAIFL